MKNRSRLRFDIQICEPKLWFSCEIYSCEIYLNVGDAGYELDFCDRITKGRN